MDERDYRDFPEARFFLRVCAVPMEETGCAETFLLLREGFVSLVGSQRTVVIGPRDSWDRTVEGALLSAAEELLRDCGPVSVECPEGMDAIGKIGHRTS